MDLERLSGTADEKGKLGAQYFIGEPEQGRGRGRRAEDPGRGGQRPHRDGESDTAPDEEELEGLKHTAEVLAKVLKTHAKRGGRAAVKVMAQELELPEEVAEQVLLRAAQRLSQE